MDHLLLLKILHKCNLGSFKVRGIINLSTVSIHTPTLSPAAHHAWLIKAPQFPAQVCIQPYQLDGKSNWKIWYGDYWIPISVKADSSSR